MIRRFAWLWPNIRTDLNPRGSSFWVRITPKLSIRFWRTSGFSIGSQRELNFLIRRITFWSSKKLSLERKGRWWGRNPAPRSQSPRSLRGISPSDAAWSCGVSWIFICRRVVFLLGVLYIESDERVAMIGRSYYTPTLISARESSWLGHYQSKSLCFFLI